MFCVLGVLVSSLLKYKFVNLCENIGLHVLMFIHIKRPRKKTHQEAVAGRYVIIYHTQDTLHKIGQRNGVSLKKRSKSPIAKCHI